MYIDVLCIDKMINVRYLDRGLTEGIPSSTFDSDY